MIDLGPLGPLMWQGSAYLPFLIAALVTSVVRGFWERPYLWIAIPMALNWAGTRLVDCSEHGCGAIGGFLIQGAGSELEAVARIALSMQGVDLISIILLLWLAKPLTFRWLLAFLFGCMTPFYLLAMVGWINGAVALSWINLLGIAQLVLIVGAAGGGSSLVDLGRRSSVPLDRLLSRYDRLAARLDALTHLAGDQGNPSKAGQR